MNNKILPCPFCGGELQNIEKYRMLYQHPTNNCFFSELVVKQDEIDKWNTRKPMERIVDRLEEMFKHHNATKTVKRLVLETVKGGVDNAIN